jgi:DNA-binding response OmpR family regulator
MNDGLCETCCPAVLDASQIRQRPVQLGRPVIAEDAASPWSYEVKTGRKPIRLGRVEYRILKFLSSKPYRAFTPRRIAQAVGTAAHPVAEDALARHIASLRNELGFFSDYVQSVPHIGYRFKA